MTESKTSSRKRKLVIVLLAGFGLVAVLLGFILRPPDRKASTQLSAHAIPAPAHNKAAIGQPAPSPAFPVRLKIPAIGVDAALEYVVLTSQGELGVPKQPGDAGWDVRGPSPGETGSSVIDGHFGYKDHIPAVFDNLHKLQVGDTIYVEDDRGATTAFVVRALKIYGQSQSDLEVFHSTDGIAHLNLITCEGTWSQSQKSYSNRLVVFTDKVNA